MPTSLRNQSALRNHELALLCEQLVGALLIRLSVAHPE